MVKSGSQADLLGILPQQPGADRVEGSGPGERVRDCAGVGRPTPGRRCARPGALISDAARREKVISRMRRGSTPLTIRWATRWASVLVFPDPAPAMTSSGAGIADAMLHSRPLLRIQLGEIGRGHGVPIRRGRAGSINHDSCSVRNLCRKIQRPHTGLSRAAGVLTIGRRYSVYQTVPSCLRQDGRFHCSAAGG